MTYVTDIAALFPAECLEGEWLTFDFNCLFESGIVHAVGTSEGPAVDAFALVVMLYVRRTCGVYETS